MIPFIVNLSLGFCLGQFIFYILMLGWFVVHCALDNDQSKFDLTFSNYWAMAIVLAMCWLCGTLKVYDWGGWWIPLIPFAIFLMPTLPFGSVLLLVAIFIVAKA